MFSLQVIFPSFFCPAYLTLNNSSRNIYRQYITVMKKNFRFVTVFNWFERFYMNCGNPVAFMTINGMGWKKAIASKWSWCFLPKVKNMLHALANTIISCKVVKNTGEINNT